MDKMQKDLKLIKQIEALYRMRQNFDPMFYLTRRAYEGKHFTFWNRTTQKIVEIPMKKSLFNQLPEIAKQTDSFENFLLATDFAFFIAPTKLSDDRAVTDSVYLSLLARDYYNKLRETTVFSDFVHFAALDNVSFIEVALDDTGKAVTYRQFEAFDMIFNPLIKNWKDQRLVIKVVKKNTEELKNSKLYNYAKDIVSGDTNLYLGWKEIFEQEKYSTFARLAKDETVLLECYMLNPEKGLTIRTLDISGRVLRNDPYPNIKVIPLVPLRIYSGAWYQPSYVYRLIPNNRALDIIANRMDDMFLRMAKGGWIKHEEENIDGGMNEETGQIINYSQKKPEQIQMPVIPGFFGSWFSTLLNLSERYGVRTPAAPKGSGIRSNSMLESIKGLTAQDNTAVINNMKSAVKDIMQITMLWLYEIWNTPQEVVYSDLTNDVPQFISAKQKDVYADQKDKLVFIPNEFKRFDVDIDNALGYTMEERKKQALELYGVKDENGKPLVSSRVVKQIFKLGSTGYVMEGEEAKMADTNEFKRLVEKIPTMTPEQKNAFQIFLEMAQAQAQTGGGDNSAAKTGNPPPSQPNPQANGQVKQPVQPQGGGVPNAS